MAFMQRLHEIHLLKFSNRFFSVLFLSISSKGLTNAERITASCHPADQISIDAFKVLIFNSNPFFSMNSSEFSYFFPSKLYFVCQAIGAITLTKNEPVVDQSDVVFVSVKPGVVPSVLEEVKSIAANKLFISVAMGITVKQIENVSKKFELSIIWYNMVRIANVPGFL